jgi:hypothetical protein
MRVCIKEAKKVTFGQLVQGKRIERHLEKVPVKAVSAFTTVGKSAARKDGRAKVTGMAKYAGDYSFPDLLHARIVRPPAHGARLTSVDAAAAEKIEGVRVVRDGDLVAVLHERRDVADKALDLVKAQFDRPAPSVDDRTIFDHLIELGYITREVSREAKGTFSSWDYTVYHEPTIPQLSTSGSSSSGSSTRGKSSPTNKELTNKEDTNKETTNTSSSSKDSFASLPYGRFSFSLSRTDSI